MNFDFSRFFAQKRALKDAVDGYPLLHSSAVELLSTVNDLLSEAEKSENFNAEEAAKSLPKTILTWGQITSIHEGGQSVTSACLVNMETREIEYIESVNISLDANCQAESVSFFELDETPAICLDYTDNFEEVDRSAFWYAFDSDKKADYLDFLRKRRAGLALVTTH